MDIEASICIGVLLGLIPVLIVMIVIEIMDLRR